jgi:hypothetical protein
VAAGADDLLLVDGQPVAGGQGQVAELRIDEHGGGRIADASHRISSRK